jgi:hypothetical protein
VLCSDSKQHVNVDVMCLQVIGTQALLLKLFITFQIFGASGQHHYSALVGRVEQPQFSLYHTKSGAHIQIFTNS